MRTGTLIAAALVLASCPAFADDESESRFEAYFDFESGVEWTIDGSDDESDLWGSGYGYFEFSVTDSLSLESEVSWDSGQDGDFFDTDEQEVWIDSLYAAYATENWYFEAGKIDPLYDTWDLSWGWYAGYQSDDLDLYGVIGGIAETSLGTDDYEHYLRFGVFREDTSKLSGSIVTGGDDTERWEGGVGNTGRFNNGFVVLSGELPFDYWEYSLGAVFRSAGEGDEEDETSLFSTLYGSFEYNELEMTPFVELLHRTGADGEDRTATTAAVGLIVDSDSWYAGGSFSVRVAEDRFFEELQDEDFDDPVLFAYDDTDYSVEVFGGYAFDSGAFIDLGYQYADEFGDEVHMFAITFGYSFSITGRKELDHQELRRKTR